MTQTFHTNIMLHDFTLLRPVKLQLNAELAREVTLTVTPTV